MIVQVIITILTPIICLNSYAQDKSYCELEVIEDVAKAKIDISEFGKVDTTIHGEHFNVLLICENETIILGNVDEKGIKNGYWSFERVNSTGYKGHITGSFKDGKMDGYWSHGPYISLYEKGKHKKTTRIPF